MGLGKRGYYEALIGAFKGSLKRIDHKILFIIFFDIAFFVTLFLSMKFLQQGLSGIVESFDYASLGPQGIADVVKAQSLQFSLRNLLFMLIAIVAGMILSAILLTTFFQAAIWSLIMKSRLTATQVLRFMLINALIISSFFLCLLFMAVAFTQQGLYAWFIPILLIFIHFTAMAHLYFARERTFRAARQGIKDGIKKIHKLVLPYIIILIVFIGFYLIMRLAINIPQYGLGISIIFILFSAYLAWARYFMIEVADNCL